MGGGRRTVAAETARESLEVCCERTSLPSQLEDRHHNRPYPDIGGALRGIF